MRMVRGASCCWVASRGIWYSGRTASPRNGPGDSIPVSIMEVAGGKTSPWKTIHPSQPVLEIHDLHVTPDGQAYAYNYVTAQSDLYVAHGLN